MKVIFLDVDGVLNSREWDAKRALTGGDLMEPDPKAIVRLLSVMQETGAEIVLSSSWRLSKDFVAYLVQRGLPIHDITPRGDAFGARADEIRAWLGEHLDVRDFVIVDDEPDAGIGFEEHFVQTNPETGLTADDAARIVGLFT